MDELFLFRGKRVRKVFKGEGKYKKGGGSRFGLFLNNIFLC